MADSTVLATRQAELSIIEIALPGHAPAAAGIVLHDPSTGEWRARFRRDWEAFAGEESELLAAIAADFVEKLHQFGAAEWLGRCQQLLSHTIRITDPAPVLAGDLDRTAARLYAARVQPRIQPFVTHLPLYSARVAAGRFLDDHEVEARDWVEAPEGLRLDPAMFLVEITGRSMEPKIPDGSLCVFRAGVAGSRQGKLLLVERRDVSESGGRYTVKRYRSSKQSDGGDGWRHATIRLEPLNPDFEAWELEDDPEKFRIIGEFVRVLEP